MQETKLLHNNLKVSCPHIHLTRLSSLMDGVNSLINGNKLSVTGLGRSSLSGRVTKHQIKKMDYLVGNVKLFAERYDIYAALARHLINQSTRPLILIDWSGVSACGNYHMLSASLCAKGRAIMIYNEVHEEKYYSSAKVHKNFLSHLANVLGKDITPIVITDAGYRNKWFKAVKAIGWDFIGRVRHLTLMETAKQDAWIPCKSTYNGATSTAKFIGEVTLAKTNPINCNLYVMKKKNKKRKHKNLKGHVSCCSQSRKNAKNASEPWLIATSLSPDEFSATRIMEIYGKRMQIEESFRDLKNHHNGFAFSQARTKSCARFEILLLIAALTSFVLWLIGLWGQNHGYEREFQANTIKHRPVLSVIFLAKEIIRKKRIRIPIKESKALFNNCASIIGELSC